MGRKKLERPNCLYCNNKVKQMRDKCCSFKCSGLLKRTRYEKECSICKKLFFVEPHREKVNRGKFCSVECRRKGVFTPEVRKKMSLAKKYKSKPDKRGENCYLWKGGITPENKRIRMSVEYRLWRDSVYRRDKFTCQICKSTGKRLNADHIKSFADYPELRLDVNNGRTLCEECHRKTDNYGFRANRKVIK